MKHRLKKYLEEYTTYSINEQRAILDQVPIKKTRKGEILLNQGEVPSVECYFVLKGCVRESFLSKEGKEITSNFYLEEQAITFFHLNKERSVPSYTYTTLEETVLVIGYKGSEQKIVAEYEELNSMFRKMVEQSYGEMHNTFTDYIASSPKERVAMLLKNRPELIDRVPQHYLASYLGLTPESFSRIKKRLLNKHTNE